MAEDRHSRQMTPQEKIELLERRRQDVLDKCKGKIAEVRRRTHHHPSPGILTCIIDEGYWNNRRLRLTRAIDAAIERLRKDEL